MNTPMERPDAFAGRERLSDEEVSSIRARTTERDLELLNAPAQRTEVSTNPGAYNNFWMDRGVRRSSSPASSPPMVMNIATASTDRLDLINVVGINWDSLPWYSTSSPILHRN
jgi:hypothetical protein